MRTAAFFWFGMTSRQVSYKLVDASLTPQNDIFIITAKTDDYPQSQAAQTLVNHDEKLMDGFTPTEAIAMA